VEPPIRATPAERRRATEEAALRYRTVSIGIGAVGLVVLFIGAIASLLFPLQNYAPFIAMEVVGLALIVVSFSRLRRPVTGIPRALQK
jgi:hypothetical protein